MPALTSRRPQLACAVAALTMAAVALGCGDEPTALHEVQLLVSQRYGAATYGIEGRQVPAAGATVLEVLASRDQLRTAPSGDIRSIRGLKGNWSVYINGIKVDRAPARARVHSGDWLWLDRSAPPSVRAVVGIYPEPFLHGRGGKRLPVRVECVEPRRATCRAVARLLTIEGAVAAQGGLQTSFTQQTLRVLVGPWSALRVDHTAALLGRPPTVSGVYARFAAGGRSLAVLDGRGRIARVLGAGSGLVAAIAQPEGQPVWLLTGTDERGVSQAVGALSRNGLVTRFAIAVRNGARIRLPALRG